MVYWGAAFARDPPTTLLPSDMRTVASILLIMMLAAAARAQAGDVRPRAGAYLDISPGYAGVSLTTSGCSASTCSASQNVGGMGWSISIGGTFDPHWRLGAQLDSRPTTFGASETEQVLFYTIAGTWYPMEESSLWIRANVGVGGVTLNGGSENTLAVGAGIGYDWFPFRSELAVSPWVSYLAQVTSGNLGGSNGLAQVKMLSVGLAVGLRH